MCGVVERMVGFSCVASEAVELSSAVVFGTINICHGAWYWLPAVRE